MNFGSACVRRAGARAVALHRRRWHGPSHSNLMHSSRCFANAGDRGSADADEEWIPPDGSPLAPRRTTKQERPSLSSSQLLFNSPPDKAPDISDDVLPEVAEDEIEVIDLEATLRNSSNQDLLRNESGASDVPSELFDVGDMQQGDSDWTLILRQLRDEGEIGMMQGLVEQYNLHSHFESLDDDDASGGEKSSVSTVGVPVPSDNEAEDWGEELEGPSQEEIIDELIESSPDLSQLEMEILEQEMDRFEAGEQDGIDYDSIEEMDLSDNATYRDFRAMVWEDYQEKNKARGSGRTVRTKRGIKRGAAASTGGLVHSPETTRASTKEEFTAYPPDWKDYDSSAAFQRDFSEDDGSWAPPSSEFIPSRSYEEGGPKESEQESDLDNTIDWLQARRSRLGEDANDGQSKLKATHMMTPEEAESFRHQNSQIPVIPHTLLTTEEISTSLSAQGGTDIHIIDESKLGPMEGNGIGCKFMMLVTGRNASHIRVLAASIVRNLKARKLAERGVIGAMQGSEGGEDIYSTKRSRARASRKGVPSTTKKIDDEWIAVDCENIHVHILDETTRRCLNIESLWDLSDPNSEGNKLRRVDFTDEDSVDNYVADNPIPDEYDPLNRGDGWITGGARIESVPIFQNNKSFSEKWSGVSKRQRKQKRTRGQRYTR